MAVVVGSGTTEAKFRASQMTHWKSAPNPKMSQRPAVLTAQSPTEPALRRFGAPKKPATHRRERGIHELKLRAAGLDRSRRPAISHSRAAYPLGQASQHPSGSLLIGVKIPGHYTRPGELCTKINPDGSVSECIESPEPITRPGDCSINFHPPG